MPVNIKNRKVRVVIGDDAFKEFNSEAGKKFMRISFNAKNFANTGSAGFNVCQINLFNLKEETSNEITKKGKSIKLYAGYDVVEPLFFGKIANVIRTKVGVDSTDIMTTLHCSNSDLNKIVVAEAISKKDLIQFIKFLCDKNNIKYTIDSKVSGMIENTTFSGTFISIIAKLSEQFNFTFFVNNGYLVIKSLTKGKVKHTFTPETGLYDIPEVTEKGVNITIPLYPSINPSDIFKLSSEFARFTIGSVEFQNRISQGGFKDYIKLIENGRYSGEYITLSIEHEGDTHDNTWQTKIDGISKFKKDNG